MRKQLSVNLFEMNCVGHTAARNFGLTQEVPHDMRYRVADEYLDVLYKLWEGSWDDDAVVRDRARGIYTDPARVRPINHVGQHYQVAGPHLCQPSPQRTPLLFQASGSPAGLEFADAIETWLDEDGIDGINLRQYMSFETVRDFIELVVPELRRRPLPHCLHGRRDLASKAAAPATGSFRRPLPRPGDA